MRIKKLELTNYCGGRNPVFDLNRDFTGLYGPNGCGKSTTLNAITTIGSNLYYGDPKRTRFQMQPYVRDGCSSFEVKGLFENEGKEYEVLFTEKGLQKSDILKTEFWWPGIVYFAKFDVDTRVFCLPEAKWEKFKNCYEGIFGYPVEPDFYDMKDPKTRQVEVIATGFYLHKPQGKVKYERLSAGEKKVAKSLSQIINLPEERLPQIVLVDNLEMHVYYKRHLKMFETVKEMFKGMQIISTSHSTVVVEQYEPKSDLIDVEQILQGENK